ncbi:MAG: 50S ribosomal protein L15 [Candidatus Margulisbacteria bacterium]|nr:50S ribosomal protein L15 [Candidatus Margulisiibacteriota bacterium]
MKNKEEGLLENKPNTLRPIKNSVKKRLRRGRGNSSGLGGECGRGHKGQKSRSGYSRKLGFEGGQMPLYRRLPKKRGFKNPFKIVFCTINVSTIEEFYNDGDTVEMESLKENGLMNGERYIKVLGNGNLKKKVTIKAHKISKSAAEKVKVSGSKLEILPF